MKGFNDLMLMPFFLIFLVTIIFIIGLIFENIKIGIENSISLTSAQNQIITSMTSAQNSIINVIPIAIISIWIGSIILAWLLPSHPIFVILWFIFSAFLELIAIITSNILWEFLNTPTIIQYANSYTFIINFVKYFPHVMAICSILYGVVLYSRIGGDSAISV